MSSQTRRIGIVFPVFHVNIPPYIRDFLERSIFNCKYLFVIATYGEYAGSTADEVKKILDKRSIPANYINNIQIVKYMKNSIETSLN